MSEELQKLAGDLQGVLTTAATHMTKMANANAQLMAVNAQQEHELKAMKLARRLEQRGLSPEYDFEAKVAKLLETPIEKLATMEQAIELATGGFRLGSVHADDKMAAEGSSDTTDVLSAFITSQAAYT
jgi:hypothetical protein